MRTVCLMAALLPLALGLSAADCELFGVTPNGALPQEVAGRLAFGFKAAETVKLGKRLDGDLSFSFLLNPAWFPGDSRPHRILNVQAKDQTGAAVQLGLEVFPSGSLVWSVNRPDWLGGVVLEDSLLWPRHEWQLVNGGWDKVKGFYLRIDDFAEQSVQIKGVEALTAVDSLTFSPGPWFADFHLGGVPVPAATPAKAVWAVSPNGDWTAGTGIFLQCRGSLRRLAPKLDGKPGALFIDCPEGITPSPILVLSYSGRTLHRQGQETLVVDGGLDIDGKVTLDGKQAFAGRWTFDGKLRIDGKLAVRGKLYKRHVYPFGELENSLPLLSQKTAGFSVCLKSSLPAGTATDIVVGCLDADGAELANVPYPVTCLDLPQAPKLKKLRFGLSNTRYDMLAQDDPLQLYQRLGVSFVDVWDYGCWAARDDQGQLALAAATAKLLLANGISPVFEAHRAVWEYRPSDCRAVGSDGKPYPSEFSRCPSDRGPRHLEDEESIKRFARMGAGVSLDVEANGLRMNAPCYCVRCLEAFKHYLAEQRPEVKAFDPRSLAADDGGLKLWRAFIGRQVSEKLYQLYQAEAEALKGSTSKPLMVLYDEGLWESGCDLSWLADAPQTNVELLMGPPLYHGAAANYKALLEYRKQLPKAKAMPYLGFSFDQYHNDMVSQLFAVYGGGAKGVIVWTWFVMSGLELADSSKALAAVSKVEDILADGEEVGGLELGPNTVGRLSRLDNRGALLVGNTGTSTQAVKVKLPFQVTKATDLLTGKGVSPEQGLPIPPGAFRLYELEGTLK